VQAVRRSSDASLVRIADASDSQLRAINTALEQVSQFKSEFLAKMSHELRTPLTGIIGFCEMLLEGLDGELNFEQAQDLGQVHRSALLLLDLVNSILDLSKIEAGKFDIDIEIVDLSEIAGQVIGAVRPLAEAKSLTLTTDVAPQARNVMGDAGRVRQVITNLVSNAIKFTPQGSVAIYTKPAGTMVEVSVLDAGIGIAPEALDRIFQEFQQADATTSRVYGGTGLGLSICHKLVELQGGRMGVESTPGSGSRFWFTLPLAVPPA
jgi:two-component system, sensor histidine kinase and response regulator